MPKKKKSISIAGTTQLKFSLMWGKIKIRSIFLYCRWPFLKIILSILRGLYIKKFLQKMFTSSNYVAVLFRWI